MDIKQADKAVEHLCSIVTQNSELMGQLRSADNWQERWVATEAHIVKNLAESGIDVAEFQTLWIRERVFCKLAEQTGLDYGWCKYFEDPGTTYRNKTRSLLEEPSVNLAHYCLHGERTETTCSGPDRDICVYLQPRENNPNLRKELQN
jgi:hypothetical protein